MSFNIPQWVFKLKQSIPEWLDGLMQPGRPFGRFRFARENCVYPEYDILSVHFAAAVYQKLRLDKKLTGQQKHEWIEVSTSWRDKETGEVRAPELEKQLKTEDQIKVLRRNLNRVGSGVFGVSQKDPPLQEEIKAFVDVEKMYQAFDAEPWETNSWGAGAHCAHYLLAIKHWVDAGFNELEPALQAGIKYLYDKQDPKTGAFGGKGQDINAIVGGMLKIYGRLFGTFGLEIKYPEQMIDTCLDALRSGKLVGNCPAHNALIVMLMCRNFAKYREGEIKEEAYKSIDRDVKPFLRPDGAFGDPYVKDRGYYVWDKLQMVKPGVDQSELHSTLIMLQELCTIAEHLDMEDNFGFAPTGWKRWSVS